MTRTMFIMLSLTGCVTAPPVVIDAGCIQFSIQRGTIPQLDLAPPSQWITVTDSAMTETCT